jgi:hypothetical protein
MPNPFDAAVKVAAASADAIMAEPFTFTPMKAAASVSARPVRDEALPVAVHVRCIWGEPSARVGSGPVEGVGLKAEKPGHASSRPFLSLALSGLPYRPQKGFLVLREDTGERFRIAEVLPSHPGFVRCDLNYLKTETE